MAPENPAARSGWNRDAIIANRVRCAAAEPKICSSRRSEARLTASFAPARARLRIDARVTSRTAAARARTLAGCCPVPAAPTEAFSLVSSIRYGAASVLGPSRLASARSAAAASRSDLAASFSCLPSANLGSTSLANSSIDSQMCS